MIYWSYSVSGVTLWRSSTSWENPHDSPVAYFTIQFVLIALQRSNCVSSICNQLTASVQLDIPVHQAYVTCVLMGGNFIHFMGHGIKTQDTHSGNLACWNRQSVCNNPGVCAHVCLCASQSVLILSCKWKTIWNTPLAAMLRISAERCV